MSIAGISLLFEGVVALLLAATIFFAIRLNRQISGLRSRESELQGMIAEFNQASGRAEASAETLKIVGNEAETSLRQAIEQAQALRDDLLFMVERGDAIANNVERSLSAARQVAGQAEPRPPATTDPAKTTAVAEVPGAGRDGGARSDVERELLRALRAKKQGG